MGLRPGQKWLPKFEASWTSSLLILPHLCLILPCLSVFFSFTATVIRSMQQHARDIANCTLHTAHYTLHTVQYKMNTTHYTLYTKDCIVFPLSVLNCNAFSFSKTSPYFDRPYLLWQLQLISSFRILKRTSLNSAAMSWSEIEGQCIVQ